MKHEQMLELMIARYTESNAEQKSAYLEAFAIRFDIDIKIIDFEQTIELFEDTRTEDQVNEMMPFLSHIGIYGYTWSEEHEIYIRKGILQLLPDNVRIIDLKISSTDPEDSLGFPKHSVDMEVTMQKKDYIFLNDIADTKE